MSPRQPSNKDERASIFVELCDQLTELRDLPLLNRP